MITKIKAVLIIITLLLCCQSKVEPRYSIHNNYEDVMVLKESGTYVAIKSIKIEGQKYIVAFGVNKAAICPVPNNR